MKAVAKDDVEEVKAESRSRGNWEAACEFSECPLKGALTSPSCSSNIYLENVFTLLHGNIVLDWFEVRGSAKKSEYATLKLLSTLVLSLLCLILGLLFHRWSPLSKSFMHKAPQSRIWRYVIAVLISIGKIYPKYEISKHCSFGWNALLSRD